METPLPEIKPRSPAVKKRNPFIAFLLAFLGTGLGQMYNGQIIKGIVLALGRQLLLYVIALGVVYKSLTTATALGLLVLAYLIYIIADAVVIAFKRKNFLLKPYNKWYFYLIFIFMVFSANIGNSFVIKHFIMEAYKIPSGSMMPTLLTGDHLMVDRTKAKSDHIAHKDIIIFKHPKKQKKTYIKRVIAVGGDSIEIRDRKVYLNGELLDEPYVMHTDKSMLPARMSRRDNYGPADVPEGKYFVLGDNRDESMDSRFWGYVNREDIKGNVLFIYFSLDKENQEVRFERIGQSIE